MIDLSNNNGEPDFERIATHHRRLYLKLTEGAGYADPTHSIRRARAHAAGLLVGEYHFARPSSHTPREEADYFLEHLPALRVGRDLRPCLDLEDPRATPSRRIATWAAEWVRRVQRERGHVVVLYGSSFYLGACHFEHPLGPLWLASYGRNDGREHPFAIPSPWRWIAAHQYASEARVPGVPGPCDLSRVLDRGALDVAVSR